LATVTQIAPRAPRARVRIVGELVHDLILYGHLPNVDRQPGAAKAVLVALAAYGDPDGTNARPSMQGIADATCFSRATVKRQLHRLAAAGVISETRAAGQHRARTWTINIGAIAWDRPPRGVTVTPLTFPAGSKRFPLNRSRGVRLTPDQ
jgi:hypothetical protein